MTLTRPVIHAMAQQLDRVNGAPEAVASALYNLQQDHYALTRRYEILKERFDKSERENKRLRELLGAAEDTRGSVAPMTYNGRPVLTQSEAARQARISVATVSRYVNSGYWEAAQEPDSNRWLIYADRPLVLKEQKRK